MMSRRWIGTVSAAIVALACNAKPAPDAETRSSPSAAVMTWEKRTMMAFSTGFGDGRYPVFVGSSSSGDVVTVVVDCEILPWQD